MKPSLIQEFYNGSCVFVTGGSGFMGRILIEKLLRDTEVKSIYVLIREKKGVNAKDRLNTMFDGQIFDRLKSEQPNFRQKVIAVQGDCALPEMGISQEDQEQLIANVQIIFHVAATVNFSEHIKKAYNVHVNGTLSLLDIMKKMKNLKVMMYVSTAYSNCYQLEADEVVYDHGIDYKNVGKILEKMSNEEATNFDYKSIKNWPNTYTYTKALTENALQDLSNGLPIGILRPGAIVSTWKEPIPGWPDNGNGITGLVAQVMIGSIRAVLGDLKANAELVPVDLCVAALIAAAWDVANKKYTSVSENSDKLPVYNYVSTPENPVTWGQFIGMSEDNIPKYPPKKVFWALDTTYTTNHSLFNAYKMLYHYSVALIIDIGTLLTGRKPKMLAMYKKIHKFEDALVPFSSRNYTISNQNVQAIWTRLRTRDKQLFPFSMTTVLWPAYCGNYVKGIRRYLLQEPDSTLENARVNYKRIHIACKAFNYFSLFILCNIIFLIFKYLINILS